MPIPTRPPRRCVIAAGLTTLLILAGCSAEKSPTTQKSVAGKTAPPAKTNGPQPNAKHPPKRQTAADAVRAVLNGFHDRKPEAVWDFLPASYQRDLNGLAAKFAERMDAELWDRFFGILRRVIALCKTREKQILASTAVARLGSDDPKQLRVQWVTTIGLAETLVNSDVASLKRLKTIDLRKFLAATGGEFLRRLAISSRLLPGGDDFKLEIDPLADIAVRVVSSDEDVAVVELSLEGTGEQPLRVPFVRVDDKWVPEKFAAAWKPNIAAWNKRLDEDLPKWITANKTRVSGNFTVIEKSLTELEATKDPAAFQQKFSASPVAGIVLWALRSGTRSGDQTPVTSLPKNGKTPPKSAGKASLTVVVQAELDDETADKVADKLFDLGKNVDVGAFVRGNGTTRFPVSSAGDFESFRKKLQFATVISADAQKREIVIKLK